jgi:hypothetical protein
VATVAVVVTFKYVSPRQRAEKTLSQDRKAQPISWPGMQQLDYEYD